MLAGQLALIAGALFTGAALYVSACEQPARLHLEDGALLTQWKPAYKRGIAMQAPLALVGALLGVIAWWQTRLALARWRRGHPGKLAFYVPGHHAHQQRAARA